MQASLKGRGEGKGRKREGMGKGPHTSFHHVRRESGSEEVHGDDGSGSLHSCIERREEEGEK